LCGTGAAPTRTSAALFNRICDYFLGLVDIALEYDIDGVYFGDDWGSKKGS
jgi:uroporphyrinogen decarboxylase